MMNGHVSAWMAAAITVASCWSSLSVAEDAQPTLSQTLAWMDSTYNPHYNTGGSWGHNVFEAHNSDGKITVRRTSTFTYDGCQITLYSEDYPVGLDGIHWTTIYRFNLRDLDPTAVTTDSMVEFRAHNQEPLVEEDVHTVYPKLEGTEHETRSKGKTFFIVFYMDDIPYMERFVKAFRHAIALCGGKSSVF
jgi:hypothetical protein